MSLLEQDINKKGQVADNIIQLEFEATNNEEYKVEAIWNSAVYKRDLKSGLLPGLYYLVLWKGYLEAKNT